MTAAILGVAALSAHYAYLAEEPGPPLLREALGCYGVQEYPGSADNPAIIGWRDEITRAYPNLSWIDEVVTGDATPWCGLFLAYVAHRAGHGAPHPRFLAARSWSDWPGGFAPDEPAVLGDVLIFWRGSLGGKAGHVGLYVGEDETHFHVLGGNQSDSVSITRIARTRLLAITRPRPIANSNPGRLVRVEVPAAAADVTENER